jgi:hypothetical protein
MAAKLSTKPVSSHLNFKDHLSHLSFRLGINRENRTIDVGVYRVGTPDNNSPVFVSANFQMSFNKLRSALKDVSAWILVIDTKGINVWCAAGKGTFGTQEIIKRVRECNLMNLVNHKNLIVPQLGAPGTSAHKIERATGFKVIYGPIRCEDINKFIKNDLKADKQMRRVEFPLLSRIALIPLELVHAIPSIVMGIIFIYILSTIQIGGGFKVELDKAAFAYLFMAFILSIVAGAVLNPILLPFIAFRSFVLKGYLLGLLTQLVYIVWGTSYSNVPMLIGSCLLFSTISAYLAFNFTGCTTFTSPSGVKREMQLFLKPMIALMAVGLVLIIITSLEII